MANPDRLAASRGKQDRFAGALIATAAHEPRGEQDSCWSANCHVRAQASRGKQAVCCAKLVKLKLASYRAYKSVAPGVAWFMQVRKLV